MPDDIPEKIDDEDLPQGHWLTEEEDREMKENLARLHFDMSLEEFTEAWKAGVFDDDRELHGRVSFLAAMLPEYWEGWESEEATPNSPLPEKFSG